MSDSHNPPRIAVLSGGVGPERDVSINSGSALADALESFYQVDLIDVKERKLPRELDPERHVVFSIIHGTFGEDGSLQAMLEEGGFSYAGCDSASSRLCMHKGNCKDKVRENGVRTVSDFRFQNPREVSASSVIENLGTELVVKPADQGSSVALHICSGEEELERALDQLPEGSWMIEKRIVGREVTIGLLQGEPLGIVEVVPEGGVYDYTRKYSAGKTEYRFPAVLDLDLEQEVRSMAKLAYDSCDCRDFARVDFMISEDGIVYFLEINTLPGLTTTSLFPKSASCSGYDFSRLSQKLLEGAMTRYKASLSILQQT
ncbi:MAG: D-alanine--D-alanine ligase [Verrucomicrobiota bacterium]|nr:D-alanine--D-alanine ligase [Verrucomicrobiota bacterium]